jgi:hypothetical protein
MKKQKNAFDWAPYENPTDRAKGGFSLIEVDCRFASRASRQWLEGDCTKPYGAGLNRDHNLTSS